MGPPLSQRASPSPEEVPSPPSTPRVPRKALKQTAASSPAAAAKVTPNSSSAHAPPTVYPPFGSRGPNLGRDGWRRYPATNPYADKQDEPIKMAAKISAVGTTMSESVRILKKKYEDAQSFPLGRNAAVYMDHVLTDDDRKAAAISLQHHVNQSNVNPASLGLPTTGTTFSTVQERLNPLVRSTMYATLCFAGVPKINGVDKWVEVNDAGNMVNKFCTGHLFFSAIPLTDDGEPSLENRLGNPEMMPNSSGQMQMNPNYWYEQINQAGKNKRMELAAFIPTMLLTESGLKSHMEAVKVMNAPNGIGLNGEYFKLILWNSYAWCYKNFMDSAICQEARKRGFWPLFLLKQCINQEKRKNGKTNHLSSTDKNGKSALLLVGFWRDLSEPGQDRFTKYEFLSVTANGSFPMIAYKGTNGAD